MAPRATRRWRTLRWREGSRGWLAAEFHAVRAWRQDAQGQWQHGWLIGERPLSGSSGERAYYWSNFPSTARLEVLVEYAHRRHHIERFHQDAKEELGWNQYQGRLWPGFHRQAALVMLSYSFWCGRSGSSGSSNPRCGASARGLFPLVRIAAGAPWRPSIGRYVRRCCCWRSKNSFGPTVSKSISHYGADKVVIEAGGERIGIPANSCALSFKMQSQQFEILNG
jgi:hypothetical protein